MTRATSADRRQIRTGESGQVLVLFLLIFTTMMLIASVAVVAGQVLVRRQQAQMVVDAAAFAGASKQAEGLNTIANLNHRSLGFLVKIQYSNLAPRFDNAGTSWIRYSFWPDWAGDTLRSYQGVFDFYLGAINVANCAYSPNVLPWASAREVVNKNFDGPQSLFKPKDKGSHGPLVVDATLVKLTKPKSYDIPPHWYLPNLLSGPGSISTCASFPVGTALCAKTYVKYVAIDAALVAKMLAKPIKYKLGRFYDNKQGQDVRFAYFLEVSQSPVIFGRNFFPDIPPIIVAAAAKPYGGYLGNTFIKGGTQGEPYEVVMADPTDDDPNRTKTKSYDPPSGSFVHGSRRGETIKATYRAKLVPLTGAEKVKLAAVAKAKGAVAGGSLTGDLKRWNPLTLLH